MSIGTPTMPRRITRLSLFAALCVLGARGGFTMDEAMAIHPDGTPVNPEALRDALRRGAVESDEWQKDEHLVDLAAGDDLEAFTDYMQQINYEQMFEEDGSAKDIKAWRQAVRDDEYYTNLLKQGAPDFLEMIDTGSDAEVQNMLIGNRMAQMEAHRAKAEL